MLLHLIFLPSAAATVKWGRRAVRGSTAFMMTAKAVGRPYRYGRSRYEPMNDADSVEFADAVQLHQVRGPWAADRLARDKDDRIAFLERTILHQH